jgi:hypothetical protein
MSDSLPHSSKDQRSEQEMEALIKNANETLAGAGAESAEQSFGLGCLLGGLPLVGGVILLYLWGTFSLIMAFIVFAMGTLALTGAAALLASFARKRRIRTTYLLSIKPEIERYLIKTQIARPEFERAAAVILPSDAPLLGFMQEVSQANISQIH